VPFRNGKPPRADLLRRELGETHLTQLGRRLPEQPVQLRDRDAFTRMRVRYSSTHSPSVNVNARPPGKLALPDAGTPTTAHRPRQSPSV
jgi:hypothetical protein